MLRSYSSFELKLLLCQLSWELPLSEGSFQLDVVGLFDLVYTKDFRDFSHLHCRAALNRVRWHGDKNYISHSTLVLPPLLPWCKCIKFWNNHRNHFSPIWSMMQQTKREFTIIHWFNNLINWNTQGRIVVICLNCRRWRGRKKYQLNVIQHFLYPVILCSTLDFINIQ